MKTLLQRRLEQRDEAVEDLLTRAEALRRCVVGGYSDVRNHVDSVAHMAETAARFAALAEDLQDVEKYGPNGGR